MKTLKLCVMSAVALLSLGTLRAQTDPQKETVIVDQFGRTNVVSSYLCEGVRNGVISGFTSKGRFHVVDAATNSALLDMNKDRNNEENVTVENVLNPNTEAVYKSLGANYLITGTVVNHTTTQEKDIFGTMQNKSLLKFSLTVYRISDGATLGSESLEATGYDAKSSDAADNGAINDVVGEALKFVDKYFKFETYIEQLEVVDKKKGAKELYIVGGIEMGVQKNQQFIVFVEKQIGSRTTKQEIGRLKAVEPMDGLSRCVVTKGNLEIMNFFNEGKKLVVVSDKQGTFMGGLLK